MKLSAYIDNLSDISMMAGQFEKLTNTSVEIDCDESSEGVWYSLIISDAGSNDILLRKGFSGMDQIFPFVENMVRIAKVAIRE